MADNKLAQERLAHELLAQEGLDERPHQLNAAPAGYGPDHIEVRGAAVHNLKQLNLDIPLHQVVAMAGVSGSGKSSLALGVLYAEGSRRYLEALSAYTRRRLTQATKPEVKSVRYIPAAIALHQRPTIPSLRSTFGTSSELLNSLRLLFSRCASHRCPNGHYVPPSLSVAAEQDLVCPECGAHFMGPSAQELSFNAQGACPYCEGTGTVRTVNIASLVPDENLTIDQGAVAPWQSLMWSLMTDVCRAMGVRTDVPFKDLTDEEKARLTKLDVHSLGENRVNVTLRNLQTFFDAFGIAEGDKMYRPEEERVVIW